MTETLSSLRKEGQVAAVPSQVEPHTTSSRGFELPPEAWPKVDNIVTEDDTPVDNWFSEKQQRLLTEPLYSSWAGPGDGRPFLVAANVGLFAAVQKPPLVPDVFLSLDVQPPQDWWAKRHRSYFFWEFGKSPEVVIEIVSNQKGGERDEKLNGYARMGIDYYVVFDPLQQLGTEVLHLFERKLRRYVPLTDPPFPDIGLGLQLWDGVYEGKSDKWLRWCDTDGQLILTGAECAEQERRRAEQERQRAEQEHQRAEEAETLLEQERQRTERMMAQLRALGVEPEGE
jgi:Uma2 family endonuclease